MFRTGRTFERREAAIEQQLEVAELALAEDERRQRLRFGCKFGLARQISRKQVLEHAAVGNVCHVGMMSGRRGRAAIRRSRRLRVDGEWPKRGLSYGLRETTRSRNLAGREEKGFGRAAIYVLQICRVAVSAGPVLGTSQCCVARRYPNSSSLTDRTLTHGLPSTGNGVRSVAVRSRTPRGESGRRPRPQTRHSGLEILYTPVNPGQS